MQNTISQLSTLSLCGLIHIAVGIHSPRFEYYEVTAHDYSEPTITARNDVKHGGDISIFPILLVGGLGLGAATLGIAAAIHASAARSNINNQVDALNTLSSTLSTLQSSQRSSIDSAQTQLTDVNSRASAICSSLRSLNLPTVTDMPSAVTFYNNLLAAFANNRCPV